MSEELNRSHDRTLSVLLAEYQRVNTEIFERLRMQKQVERIILIVVGLLVAGSAFVVQSNLFIILPLSTVIFCILTISFFEQDINITVLAGYSHKVLRKEICVNINDKFAEYDLLNWELFRKNVFLNTPISKYLTLNRTSILYIPSVFPTILFIYMKYYTEYIEVEWSNIEIASIFAAAIGMIAIIYFAIKVPRLYSEIASID